MNLNQQLPPLYLITGMSQAIGCPLVEVIRAALEGGVRTVQLREKNLDGRELFKLARELRELTQRYGAKLLVNDRVDIAIAVWGDGVHLGENSVTIAEARLAFKKAGAPSPVIGVSTHSLEEALAAESDGADFITFGPVYFTPSKASYGKPVGIENLKEVARAVSIPVFALGGIKKETIKEVLNSGAYGVALISAIMAADDVKKASEELFKVLADYRPPATDT